MQEYEKEFGAVRDGYWMMVIGNGCGVVDGDGGGG